MQDMCVVCKYGTAGLQWYKLLADIKGRPETAPVSC